MNVSPAREESCARLGSPSPPGFTSTSVAGRHRRRDRRAFVAFVQPEQADLCRARGVDHDHRGLRHRRIDIRQFFVLEARLERDLLHQHAPVGRAGDDRLVQGRAEGRGDRGRTERGKRKALRDGAVTERARHDAAVAQQLVHVLLVLVHADHQQRRGAGRRRGGGRQSGRSRRRCCCWGGRIRRQRRECQRCQCLAAGAAEERQRLGQDEDEDEQHGDDDEQAAEGDDDRGQAVGQLDPPHARGRILQRFAASSPVWPRSGCF